MTGFVEFIRKAICPRKVEYIVVDGERGIPKEEYLRYCRIEETLKEKPLIKKEYFINDGWCHGNDDPLKVLTIDERRELYDLIEAAQNKFFGELLTKTWTKKSTENAESTEKD